MTITRVTPAAACLLLAAGLAGLSGCTGGSSGGTKTSPSASASGSGGVPGKDVSSQYLTVPTSSPVAGADGSVPLVGSGSMPVRLDVLSLSSRGGSTVLLAHLSSTSDQQPSPAALSVDRQSERLTGLSLVSGDQRFHPAAESIGTSRQQQQRAPRCACSPMPQKLSGGGADVSVQYGVLPDGVGTVKLEAPGFPAISVPVTRS